MTALARIPNEQGIHAMQSINATILNPLFGTLFTGTALTSIVLAVVSIMRWGTRLVVFACRQPALFSGIHHNDGVQRPAQ